MANPEPKWRPKSDPCFTFGFRLQTSWHFHAPLCFPYDTETDNPPRAKFRSSTVSVWVKATAQLAC